MYVCMYMYIEYLHVRPGMHNILQRRKQGKPATGARPKRGGAVASMRVGRPGEWVTLTIAHVRVMKVVPPASHPIDPRRC